MESYAAACHFVAHRRNLLTYNWLEGINLSAPAILDHSETPFADIWSFPTKQWAVVPKQVYFLLPPLPQAPSLAPKGCHLYKFKDNGHGNANMTKQLLHAPKIRLHCRLFNRSHWWRHKRHNPKNDMLTGSAIKPINAHKTHTFLSPFSSSNVSFVFVASLSSIPSVKRMIACVQFEDVYFFSARDVYRMIKNQTLPYKSNQRPDNMILEELSQKMVY